MLERLRELLGGSPDTSDENDGYRCVSCGREFTRPHRECPECGGPYVAPVDDQGRKA